MEVSNPIEPPSIETQDFPGEYRSLEKIANFVRAIAQRAGFDKFAVYSIEMAVDEACSNIIEHAYGGEGEGEIRCTCQVTDKALSITLCDQGKSFDPSQIPPPNLSSDLDERKANGLGMYFIHKWMDEVTYNSASGENILKMVKRK